MSTYLLQGERELITRRQRFIALKILRGDSTSTPGQPDEADILQHLKSADTKHPGYRHIVRMTHRFTHSGPNGQHSCIVFEPLGESVLHLQKRSKNGRLPLDIVKAIARQTLLGLDYLHRRCNIIHTGIRPHYTILTFIVDLQSGNLLVEIDDVDGRIDHNPQDAIAAGCRHICSSIPSKPIELENDEPLRVRIADFGVGSFFPCDSITLSEFH